MGYTTDFEGSIRVEPPLSPEEIAYLTKFATTRRMHRRKGPYFVEGTGYFGQDREEDVIDYDMPDPSQPGLWCQWASSEDGKEIAWDGNEKFYHSEEWMKYIIDYFIGASPKAKKELPFLNEHTLNGEILAQGEDIKDRWKLIVKDNVVSVKRLK